MTTTKVPVGGDFCCRSDLGVDVAPRKSRQHSLHQSLAVWNRLRTASIEYKRKRWPNGAIPNALLLATSLLNAPFILRRRSSRTDSFFERTALETKEPMKLRDIYPRLPLFTHIPVHLYYFFFLLCLPPSHVASVLEFFLPELDGRLRGGDVVTTVRARRSGASGGAALMLQIDEGGCAAREPRRH